MASIFTENFEGGTNGAAVTASNSAFSSISGSGLTFTNSPTPPQGALALSTAAGSGVSLYGTATLPTAEALLFTRLYCNPPATLTGSIEMIAARGSNTARARLRLNADRTVSLLNGSTVVWTSTTVLPAGQWSRLEWRLDNSGGQQQARLYVGADPNTTTVTEDSAGRTYNQGTIDSLRVGQANSATTAATTVYYDALAADDATWIGPASTGTPTLSASFTPSVTLTASLTALNNTATASFSLSVTLTAQIEAVPVPTPSPSHVHDWKVWARDTNYQPSLALKIVSIDILRKHMDVNAAVLTVLFTPDVWDATAPGAGVIAYRDGRKEFEGPVAARELSWDATQGLPQISLQCVGDEQHLADRLCFPDPLDAADAQTTNDVWVQTTLAGSSVMWQLISDQAGPTARADRQVSGLQMGVDPGVGIVRRYDARLQTVMYALQVFSVASGADLGIRMTAANGQLTVDVVQPRDLTGSMIFAADLRNLVGISYRETAPTVTHALGLGSGTLATRVAKAVVTASSLALSWGRQIWSVVDRSDTSDATVLGTAAQDAIDQGAPTVSLVVTLTDSQAAKYGIDYDLGDKVTVFVGLPGQTQVATVQDVIRQIRLQVDNTGKEIVTPAIGSYDAKAILQTPSQEKLAAASGRLDALIARK